MRPGEAGGPQGARAERRGASANNLQHERMLRVLTVRCVRGKSLAAQNSRSRQGAMGLAHMSLRNCTKAECGGSAAIGVPQPRRQRQSQQPGSVEFPGRGPAGRAQQEPGRMCALRAHGRAESSILQRFAASKPRRCFSSRGAFAAPAHSLAAQPWRGESPCSNGSSCRTRLPLKPTGGGHKGRPRFHINDAGPSVLDGLCYSSPTSSSLFFERRAIR